MAAETITYVAEYGDYLVRIAEKHRTTWQAIWSHPGNAAHRAKRGSPDVLYPGDALVIPVLPSPPTTPPKPLSDRPPPFLPGPPRSWPYPPAVPEIEPRAPTWECPDGTCVCHPEGAPQTKSHTIFLYDDASRRMPGAQCRVTLSGRPLASPTQADATGAIELHLPSRTRSLIIEWAPNDAPLLPTLPYRRLYHVTIDVEPALAVRQRLEHIGVSSASSLEAQIAEFQRSYDLPIDGTVPSVIGPLVAYHDTGMLPALESPTPLAPDVRSASQGAVSAVSDRDVDCHFSFRLLDHQRPMAHEPFVVATGHGRVFEGVTDAEGRLEYGDVAAGDYLLQIANLALYVPALPKEERHRPLIIRPDL